MADSAPQPMATEVVPEGESEAFIPYPQLGEDLGEVPIHVRPELHYYVARMGFLPNTLKLYLHLPWVAEPLFRLNNAIMRDERNGLSEELMYRLAAIASRDNECEYCTAHHATTLQRRWGYDEDEVRSMLELDDPGDERERVASEFVHRASLDPTGVTDELRSRLAELFTPDEVMQIVLVLGFWKMYNTMHSAMAAPLEEPVKSEARWVETQPGA